MTNLNWFRHFIITTVLQVDPLNLSAGQNLSKDDQVLQCDLIENIPLIFVVLMQYESNMRACKLKIQCFFLFLLEGRLWIIIGIHQPQLSVLVIA